MDTFKQPGGRSLSSLAFKQPGGRSLSSLAISYPDSANSETARKKYKAKTLRDFPEALKADFMVLNDREIKADLLFYTDDPNAWDTAFRSAMTDLKMAGNKTMRQLYLDTSPKFTVNLYNNGTVMAQGSETSLEEFEKDFPNLSELV